ncbi:hypothetical protein CAPTEDRAFT_216744 [Capitella teleta]|uniref:F5/8 type C domain-containing protein n=1 Tax=Capitella teleta TaxID=283909 RepID=R7U0E7_CAPTE|nr:hypothetical protein CAPTEDRAFT_216744 [Capitella teleta]|eukprot:ELT96680.1 hypothetical protein CAPTEDRAFT_216744 [Capitella teleta]
MSAHLLRRLLLLVYLQTAASTPDCEELELSPLITGPDGVKDDQLSASSIYSSAYVAKESRFTSEIAWCKNNSDPDPWLQVTFEDSQTIFAIQTLGNGARFEFVKNYTISYSLDGSKWNWFTSGNGTIHTEIFRKPSYSLQFSGNVAPSIPVRNDFETPIVARFVKLHPLGYYEYRSVRWELYKCLNLDCEGPELSPLITGPGGVNDDQLSASSIYCSSYVAKESRFNVFYYSCETASGSVRGHAMTTINDVTNNDDATNNDGAMNNDDVSQL